LVSTTAASGTAEPELSVTVPVNVAVTVWPNPNGAAASQAIATNVALISNRETIFLNPLFEQTEISTTTAAATFVWCWGIHHHAVVATYSVVEGTCP
jgi:hypothetical protein